MTDVLNDLNERLRQKLVGYIGQPVTPEVQQRMADTLAMELPKLMPPLLHVVDVSPGVLPDQIIARVVIEEPLASLIRDLVEEHS